MSRRVRTALSEARHRPWPLNPRPWVMVQSWHDLLFAHWAISPSALARHVPAPLKLDTFDGDAWLGVVTMRITGARPRAFPPLPGTTRAFELNVRTYVSFEGKPGVLFLSLDSSNLTHVAGARLLRLPYFPARISMHRSAEVLAFSSRRRVWERDAGFHAIYSAAGPSFNAEPGSLDAFLLERYALYTASARGLHRLDIQHPPWRLQPARGEIEQISVVSADGVEVPKSAPLLHFAARQDMLMWLPHRVAERSGAVGATRTIEAR